MLHALAAALAEELAALERQGRLRHCPEVATASRTAPTLGGGPTTSFCSNDYLGLANHSALAAAAAAATRTSGYGASSSRLIAGDFPEHRQLEAKLAALVRAPAALLFPTGYQANVGLLTALAGPTDLVASDAANHASIIDGCRLSRARIARYRHCDPEDAARALATPGAFRRRLLVTESLFSMDGDAAPLPALAAVAVAHDAALVVDEAHALGALGPEGRGLCAATGVTPDALVGTLGKAFAALGGFVAGPLELRAYLVNRARTFIYTTASPPPIAAAANAAVDLATGPDGGLRRDRLRALTEQLAGALDRPTPPGPILPVILGPDSAALAAAAHLRSAGLFVQAIRPPTVPEGSSRLRITLSAAHDPADVDRLAAAVRSILR